MYCKSTQLLESSSKNHRSHFFTVIMGAFAREMSYKHFLTYLKQTIFFKTRSYPSIPYRIMEGANESYWLSR